MKLSTGCDGKHATAHECCSSVDRPFAETERADGHIRLSRLLRIDDEHFEERHGLPGCDYCAAMARKGILSSVNNAFLTGCYPALFKLAQYRHGITVSSVSQPSVELAQQHGLRAVFFVVDVNTTDLAHLADMFDAQELIASVGAVLPLAEARTAHELLEGKGLRGRGKIARRIEGQHPPVAGLARRGPWVVGTVVIGSPPRLGRALGAPMLNRGGAMWRRDSGVRLALSGSEGWQRGKRAARRRSKGPQIFSSENRRLPHHFGLLDNIRAPSV